MKHILPLPALLACAASLSAQTAITVYNGNFGVVRDTVPLDLKQGITEQSYSGVTAQLEPESVILRDPSGKSPSAWSSKATAATRSTRCDSSGCSRAKPSTSSR